MHWAGLGCAVVLGLAVVDLIAVTGAVVVDWPVFTPVGWTLWFFFDTQLVCLTEHCTAASGSLSQCEA